MSRVSQLAQQTLTLNNVLDAQSRIQDTQIQIATGITSLSYAGISKQASRLVSLESLQTRLNQFSKNNTIIESRLQRMDQAVSTIFDSMSDLRRLLIQRLNATAGSDVPLAAVAQNLLDVVAGQLNAKDNNRFLFAGTRTDTPPVIVPVPDPATFGVPEANYYQGNSIELTTRVDDSITITYGMTADRAAFQDVIAALKAAIQGDATDDSALMDKSLELAGKAIDALAGFRAEIGADLNTIFSANQRTGDFLIFVENSIIDILAVDIPAAVIKLASDQTILQASYLTLARVSSLSLVNFLN